MNAARLTGGSTPFALLTLVVLAITFAADLSFPLGTAVWVIYLLPTVIAYAAPNRMLPAYAMLGAMVLTAIGFFLAPAGVDPAVAAINRAMAMTVSLILAAVGHAFIGYRLQGQHDRALREADSDLARAVAGEKSIEELGQTLLDFLASRFGATGGLAYVRNGEAFRRVASLGVPADAAVPDALSEGNGLLADLTRRGELTVLTDVPPGYMTIGSGLGAGPPRRLVLATTQVDGLVNAVLEFGFLDHDQARPDDLVELLRLSAGHLGVTIRSAKYRAHVQALLAETQQQAEELQAQSEELRAGNEELEAQAQLLLQSQAQLEDQQAELERSNAQLEEQAVSLEAQRDQLTTSQKALEAQAEDLEQASRYKSEFLANMSHELRTPLNSLLIMARLLAENRAGNLDEQQVRFAETIESSGNDLLSLINDILDISKIEAGKLELQVRPVTLSDTVARLEGLFTPAAAAKGIGLSLSKAADLPATIQTDGMRLDQVLRNFLSNAIKFTDKGEVSVQVARRDGGLVAFAVTDSGPGIPASQHEAIFDAFRQADGSVSRKFGGTGLGLAISRELAGLLGGTIELKSAPGEGSTFTLVVPEVLSEASSAADRSTDRAPKTVSSPRRPAPSAARLGLAAPVDDDRGGLTGDSRIILIVEDDPAFARILCDVAHEQGFACLVAATADEGALLARQYVPQAVILDMHLPDHTGLSVLDRIKRDVRTRHIPVHIVSADHDQQAALEQGAVGYLFKPVSRDDLTTMLERLEERIAKRLRRVLVVEDDPRQAESIRLLLAARDVETVSAHTAAEALQLLGSQTFDCMVLDLNLPDRAGLDFLEQLSTDDSVGFPPVIVYTGRDLSSDEEMRLRRYSKSIIVKGAKSPERLLDEVTLFLHQVVSDLPSEQQELISRALQRDAALEGRSVLVVEDDVRNIYALTSVLEPQGVTVRIARNGLEALAALELDNHGVDLVLMDVMMPELDGLAATRRIREMPRLASLPIIMLTAKAGTRDQQDCLAAGANDYLAKPLDIDKLLSLVRVWMPR
jgi:signal transduction histidine kinase/CheY-like chemotaxis protein